LFNQKEIYAAENIRKIEKFYNWDIINSAYEAYILKKIE
jgi:hypothetical protein